MPILDSDQNIPHNMDNYIKEQALKELFYASLLIPNVSEVETDINPVWKKNVQTWHVDDGSTKFLSDIVEILKTENSPFNPMLRPHLGRPVYTLDCRYLHKGDAIGWLEKVSNLPNSPMPILVIEHITEIPEEDANHDNPQYVRNVLMHSWKNPMNELFNANTGTSFKIVPADYTIFITWIIDKREKMDAIHQPSDGFAWVGNLEEYFNNFKADFKDESIKDLEETHIISYEK
jgi:hypothetical protein